MRRSLLTLALCLLAFLPALSEEIVRPVTSAWTVEAGWGSLKDTYLSPLTYRGANCAIAYERFQAMRFDPQRWVMRLDFMLSGSTADNVVRNASMRRLELEASWGMLRRFQLPQQRLTLAFGGSTTLSGGAFFLSRNGNNPVAAKAAWTINLTGMATWRAAIGRLPIVLRYQPTLPLLGCFFSPQYGELYYEIYLGNRDGLVHFAWPGNRFAMENLATADLRFGATALRLGYRGEILISSANHLSTRLFTHNIVVGISGEWLSLGSKGLSVNAKIISAYY